MLTTPVEIVVIINLTHAMVLAMEIEFFAVVDVYQKTTCKNIFSSSNYDKGFVIMKRLTYKN